MRTKRYKEMLVIGSVFGVGAVLIGQAYALNDYWNPPYLFGKTLPFEDFLYGFFFGGIVANIPDFFHRPVSYVSRKPSFAHALLGLSLTIVAFTVLVDVLKINSIVAHIVPPALVGVIIALRYKSLFSHMVIASLISMMVTFIVFQVLLLLDPLVIERIWMMENLNGLLIIGIPVEEYIFAGALGFGTPYFYEVVKGTLPQY
jgi:hypothetical protein